MSKYHNRKTSVNGILFDSRKEANRYRELLLLMSAGEIKHLVLQMPFELVPKQEGERSVKYIADFYYFDIARGSFVAEDVKGFRTDVYKIKRKLFKYRYPDIIFEEI